MITKTFEIRDAGTFIPVLAVKLSPGCPEDRYLLARAGFGRDENNQGSYVLLCQINGGGGESHTDPYDWRGPATTIPEAHRYLIEHFDEEASGAVIDVEFIGGRKPTKKISERLS